MSGALLETTGSGQFTPGLARGGRDPQDADPDEATWTMAGSPLELLEICGAESVREQR